MRFSYDLFTNFVGNLDLASYRDKYSRVKIVEMDLPKNIQALDTIYDQYWNNISCLDYPLSFEQYYEIYMNTYCDNICAFWCKSGFGDSCDCFPRGLEARIYRTWISLLTQIHAGFVAGKYYVNGTVKMGTDLDHKNVDILVQLPDSDDIKIQIKKVTHRPEFSRRQDRVQDADGIYPIWYVVPKFQDYKSNSYYLVGSRKGELRDSLKEFVKFNEHGTLDMLDNGFVIFTPEVFSQLSSAF